MTNVRQIYREAGWAGVLLEVDRKTKLAHLKFLESVASSTQAATLHATARL